MQNKILALLGLAKRGRNLVSGEFQTEEAIKNGSALLVIVAEDASDNTKKHFRDKCTFYEVPVCIYGKKEELGRAIGMQERASIGICNAGLAEQLEIKIRENQQPVE